MKLRNLANTNCSQLSGKQWGQSPPLLLRKSGGRRPEFKPRRSEPSLCRLLEATSRAAGAAYITDILSTEMNFFERCQELHENMATFNDKVYGFGAQASTLEK